MTHTLFWLLCLFAAVGLLAAVARHFRKNARIHRQQQGLQWLQGLRGLMELLQKHRGLSTGYVNGDGALLAPIQDLQQEVDGLMRQLSDASPEVARGERWQGLSEHWERLSRRFRHLSPADNLRQHNQLLQSLLYLIDDLAQQSDLMLLRTQNNQPLMLAWRELLTAVECIGQVRAVGTGAVASGGCDTVTRIRLTYLCQKIERTSSTAWGAIAPNDEERAYLKELLDCVYTELIDQRELQLDVRTYFTLATRTTEALYRQYDEVMDWITRHKVV